MYDEASDTPTVARTSNLNEELGQVCGNLNLDLLHVTVPIENSSFSTFHRYFICTGQCRTYFLAMVCRCKACFSTHLCLQQPIRA